jgi:hypothetical protein
VLAIVNNHCVLAKNTKLAPIIHLAPFTKPKCFTNRRPTRLSLGNPLRLADGHNVMAI